MFLPPVPSRLYRAGPRPSVPLHTDPKQAAADNDLDPFCLSALRIHPVLAAIIIIVFNIFFVLVLVLTLVASQPSSKGDDATPAGRSSR